MSRWKEEGSAKALIVTGCLAQRYKEEILKDKGNDKFLLDLWECNRIIFEEAGVLPENINLPDLCTCCNSEFLFSHRATNGKRGNLAAFLSLK